MTSLDLHNRLFTSESDKHAAVAVDQRLLSLSTVQEPSNPTSLRFNSPAYLDLLSRQPLHPDGPRHWDFCLDLTGDPTTVAERKSLEVRATKAKLRRLQTICVGFEVVLGMWSIYCTIRYFLAFNMTSISSVRTLALVLCITSAIALIGVAVSLFMPLLPKDVFVRTSPHARRTLRGCYIVLIVATAIANLVFILLWHPIDRCSLEMDISWSDSHITYSTSPQCHSATLAAWTAVASLRVIVTLIIVLLYIYFLRAYFVTRHPSKCTEQMRYPQFMASDDEPDSPVSFPSTSMTHINLKLSTTALGRSRSSSMSNSSTTVSPTISFSNQSHSHSNVLATKPRNHVSLSARSPPIWSNFPVAEPDHPVDHQSPHGRSQTPRTLHQKTCTSKEHILRDPDVTDAWEGCTTEMHTVFPGVSRVISHTVENLPLVSGRQDERLAPGRRTSFTAGLTQTTELSDCSSVDSYGYGASEPAYPYLDVYNPSIERSYTTGSSANMSQPPRIFISGTTDTDTSEDTTTVEDDSVEDELVPMMGGFVRRMATIESFGSREAAASMARSHLSRFSEIPTSLNSSPRLATYTPSMTSTLSKNNSLGTTYYSVSSGMGSSDMTAVNEQGELESRISRRSPPFNIYTRD